MRPLFPLALATFAVGTDAFVMAGLLPAIAADLGVSISAAGQLVTVFALTLAVAAPVLPEVALAQRDAEEAAKTDTGPGPEVVGPRPTKPPVSPVVEKPRNVRFFGVHKLDPERYARDWNRVAQEVLQHLAAVDGAQLEVRVEITARQPDGFPDDKVRVVTENAKVLKFEQFGFEDD